MKGDLHVRFRENAGVRFPCVTRLCAMRGHPQNSEKLKLAFTILLSLFVSLGTLAQNKAVSGLLLDQELSPVCGAFIYVNDSVVGKTNAQGKYEISLPPGVDSIFFGGVGYEKLLVKVAPDCGHVDAIMILAGSYDFMSPKKVDRQRRRYFEKIRKLYPIAVQKGLFASSTPCYKVVFLTMAPGMMKRYKGATRD